MENNSTNPTAAISLQATQKDMGKSSLQYLPVGLFGSTVAISGLSIAWNQASVLFELPGSIAIAIAILAWAMYILLISLYITKIIRYPEAVKKELTNPVTGNFLGTFFISTVLLSAVTIPFSLDLARIVWIAGTTGGSIFMYILTSRLFKGQLSILDAEPPSLIPGLTLLNAVIAGTRMEFGWLGKEINLILFSVGIVYVFSFFITILFRLIYKEPVIPFLVPTLLLMSAPFEVGVSAYMSQTAHIDFFASVIFFFGLFTFIVIFFQILKKRLPFMISWWSSCFSIGALTNAALKYSIISHGVLEKSIAGILLVVASLFMAITFVITIKLQWSGRLLKP